MNLASEVLTIGRLEKFREARRARRRYISAFLLFFLLMLPGVFIVDYFNNYVLKNRSQVGIINFEKVNDHYWEISCLDKKFHINTRYVSRDLRNLKNRFFKTSGKNN